MRTARVLRVVGGVAITSALVGAVAGALCAAVLSGIYDGVRAIFTDAELYRAAAVIGASCGVVLGPAAIFGFMRRVPLGRLFVQTGVGTVIGGVVGFTLPLSLPAVLGVAAVGFLTAGARLAWVHRAGASAASTLPSAG